MIYIEKNQSISENENIKVFSPTGSYEDMAMIEYYSVAEPDVAQGAFHAQFVKYGSLVYKFSDPRELGVEILKIDPESTHSAASFVRMQNELLAQFNQGSLEPESLSQVLEDEQIKMEEQVIDKTENDMDHVDITDINNGAETSTPPIIETASTTDPVIDADVSTTTPVSDIGTTTPSVIDKTSSTTPSIIESIIEDAASSTLDAILPEATSTQALKKLKVLSKKVRRGKLS